MSNRPHGAHAEIARDTADLLKDDPRRTDRTKVAYWNLLTAENEGIEGRTARERRQGKRAARRFRRELFGTQNRR